jgi:hypothetical protein
MQTKAQAVCRYIGTYAGMPTNFLRQPTPEARDFARWLTRFNDLLGERWPGCTLLELAERPWHDWHADGDTPEDAVAEVERDQGDELDERFN